jgi:transcriptional regulator of arginine metabolism
VPNSTQQQSQRRDAIRQLLSRGPAETQRSLVDALTAAGHIATQSSVSRDLHELGAIKTGNGYELPGSDQTGVEHMAAVTAFVRSMQAAGPNLLVVKTAIGAAQRVALAFDRCGWAEIVGNIGGDDTVFVATNSVAAQKRLIAKIGRAGRAGS